MIDFVPSVLAGDRLALARLLTRVENDLPEGRAALDALFPGTGKAHIVGITGAPGTGKSSLANQLALAFRKINVLEEHTQPRVAVVCVDPSSPFTGGAILGDRVRMRDLSGDPGIFIRSMASRGALGGLSRATAAVVQVLDAAGFEWILIETVGAGQSEVEIARLAHTTIVVEAPGMGDDIQAIKAGILEIADILVVNKSDQPGAENTVRSLRMMIELAHPDHLAAVRNHHGHPVLSEEDTNQGHKLDGVWVPPVHQTVATHGDGIDELAKMIIAHREQIKRTGEWQQRARARLKSELDQLVQSELMARWQTSLPPGSYERVFDQLYSREISPYTAVQELIGKP